VSGTHSNGQVVAASELGNLADAAERCAHDNGLVAVLLVVVEDLLDALDTGVLLLGVLLLGRGLVPVQDTANEGRDEESTGLGGSDGLDLGEHEGQVAVDTVLGLKDLSGLDSLPCGRKLDENALLADANLFVEVDDVQRLVYRLLGGEGEARINFCGDLAGHNLEDFLAKLYQQVVKGSIDLVLNVGAVLLAVCDGRVDQLLVLGLLRRGENERGVGGGILGLVLLDGSEVTRVGDNGLCGRPVSYNSSVRCVLRM
jgi:hypothetical protein